MVNSINDSDILENSTRFVVNHLLDEPKYNYFNDPQEKQQFDHGWNQLIHKQQDYNGPDNLLRRNRERLTYLLNNFHIITPENPYPKFDEEYICSAQYSRDLSDATRDTYISFSDLTRKILVERNKSYKYDNFDPIIILVNKLSTLSWLFSVPMPQKEQTNLDTQEDYNYEPNNSFIRRNSDSELNSLPCYMDGGKPVFEIYFKIIFYDPSYYGILGDTYLEQDMKRFKIDKSYLQNSESIGYYHGITHDRSRYFEESLIDPIKRLLCGHFEDVELEKTYYRNETIIPSCCLRINKLGINFSIPIEFKQGGIYDLCETQKDKNSNTAEYHHFINQIVFQMINYKSKLGFAIDFDCFYVIKFYENPNPTKYLHENGKEYNSISCAIRCFKHSMSEYSISSLLLLLTSQYFHTINKDEKKSIINLYNEYKLDKYYST
ncbi:hypothetical protein DFJ63DRAFT_314843 [Scheffersomyces coipomensis]|uniref:uncharacterized protein n=1 Tax=Scheffersomyces coipomensis TaxID=1788519 RepID=UPI00315D12A0